MSKIKAGAPWHAYKSGGDTVIICGADGHPVEGHPVVNAVSLGGTVNAQLIASAPELLIALEHIRDAVKRSKKHPDLLKWIADRADGAIHKAKEIKK